METRLTHLFGTLNLAGGALKRATFIQTARVAGRLRNPRQIISAWPDGPILLAPKIAVFMHFDRQGRVGDQAQTLIRQFTDNGYSVVFVTNSARLTPAGQNAVRQLCAAVFIRRNIGYDFGAWRDVIHALNLPAQNTKELVLLNDSMYGPLRPLDAMLARLNYAEADIWGLTESWQERYHLQSYFLGFGEKALHSPAFAKFWSQVLPVPSKSFIVRAYEVGLTQAMLRAGLKCKAIWSYEDLVAKVAGQNVLDDLARAERQRSTRGDPVLQVRKRHIGRIRNCIAKQTAMNPTAEFWRQLLHSGFPFIKRELLRKNPTRVADIGDWLTVVRGELGLDPEPILAELRGGLKNRAP